MKRLILFVFVSMIVSSNLLGQSLPTSVDNSQWFPPARTQYWNSCTVWAMVYGLKSYEWNRALNRNPALEENQFSPYFVWNQVVFPSSHFSIFEVESDFLIKQGAATVADFGVSPQSEDIQPTPDVMKKALAYRSGYNVLRFIINPSNADSAAIQANLDMLKDSLSHGKCFALTFRLFTDFNELYYLNPPIYKYKGLPMDSVTGVHTVAVVGYDDALKAFKCLNSYGEDFGDAGYFYYDYSWFFAGLQNVPGYYSATFLSNERIGYSPELILDLQLNGSVNGDQREQVDYIITDTTYVDADQQAVDSLDYMSYTSYPTLSKMYVNGQEPNGVHNNRLLIPAHNHNGNYRLISDLTDYTKANNFHSAQIVVYDPVSATYSGENGSTLYSYSRTPTAQVTSANILYTGNGKQIVGAVTYLPDTVVVCENYWSSLLSFKVTPTSSKGVFVSQSTCTFRRILVTFTDALNAPPVLVTKPDTLLTNPDSIVTFQFEAYDPDGDSVRYSVSGDSGASINPTTGLFSYKSSRLGSYDLTIMITDGTDAVVDSFIVRVDNTVGVDDDPFAIPTECSLAQNYPNPFNPTTTINFSIVKSSKVMLKVYDLLGREVATLVDEYLSAGAHNTKFDASNLASGIYLYSIQTSGFTANKKMILMK